MILLTGETEIACDSGNNYDLYLAKLKSGHYKLIVFMKLQFFFEDDHGLKWAAAAKTKFVNDWKTSVKKKWGTRVIKPLSGGKTVTLEFRFKTQIGGWMWDHWEITVNKIPKGAFEGSYVRDGWINNANLDSEDLTLVHKQKGHSQRGAVHEFGHMLGLADEYLDKSAHKKDFKSIMHSGERVVARHDSALMKWLNKELKDHSIK